MKRVTRRFIAQLLVLISLVSLFGVSGASARERAAIKSCSLGNSFEFSVDWERNRVDFDFDIEQGALRDKWTVKITRNSETLVRQRFTSDEDGDLSKEYVRSGQFVAGERWTFRARSESGNVCKATLRF